MKAAKTQTTVLMEVLRELLRVRGIRTREIAAAMNVTARTVERWFISEAADTQILEKLCALLDITLFELCELAAKRVENRPVQLTVAQEQALVDYPLLNYLFIHILKGWTAPELQGEINIPEPMFIDALFRLEKIGLIGVLPGNEIRLRTAKDVKWRARGPYSRYLNMIVKRSLDKPDITEARSHWAFETLKLSSGSLAQLERKFEILRLEAVALSQQDRRSNDTSRDWYALVLTVRHFDMTPLSEWPTQYEAPTYGRHRTGIKS